MTMTLNEAEIMATAEFEKFQRLFAEKMAEFPALSYDEIDSLVVYEHPEFEDAADQNMYDVGILLVASKAVLSNYS